MRRELGQIRRTAALVAATLLGLALASNLSNVPAAGAAVSHQHSHGGVLGDHFERLPNGLYRVTLEDGYVMTTHGPDPKSAFDGHGIDLGPGDPEREPVCATDYYQHVLYGRPAHITQTRLPSVIEEIRTHFRRMNAVLNEDALESGGTTADYKVLCDSSGKIQVDEFVNNLLLPDVYSIIGAARAAGFNKPNVDYTIFYDGNFPAVCGIAEFADDDSLSESNRNNSGGYGITYEDCWFSRTPMHENGHNQGAVQNGAPDSDGGGHCSAHYDVMCYPSNNRPCPDVMHYDCGFDSYFDASPEPGEWLADHWNIGSRLNRFIVFGDTPQKGSRSSSARKTNASSRLSEDTLVNPEARLRFSDRRPKRGERLRAVLSLGHCSGLEGTRIYLQRKVNGSFKNVSKRRLDEKCRAVLGLRANFSTRVFRSYWPQQDDNHRADASAPQRIRTRT
jgi:hypothetical protein